MEQQQLNQEQANDLLERALILISQQNRQEKLKILKPQSSPSCESPELRGLSSHPNSFKSMRPPSLEMPFFTSQSNLEISPAKQTISTNHPFPIQRMEGSLSWSSSSLSSPLKHPEKDPSFDDSPRLPIRRRAESQSMLGEQQMERGRQMSQIEQELEGRLFVEGEMKDIKRDLEIRSRGKICKSQDINTKSGQIVGYHFYCKCDPECPFDCFLEYTGNRNSQQQKVYKLIIRCFNHNKQCLEEEQEINFIKMTRRIDSLENLISDVVTTNPQIKPKDILGTLAQRLGQQSHRFIYVGLHSKSYHKAAKKYFDNLIYKVKTQLGLF